MKNTTLNLGYSVPSAYITKGKQRIKQFDGIVYLNNGDEFEIELFNPTINKILAKIELNGLPISSGIVLRPGERVFLDRYIDEPKKFLFETYKVDRNNDTDSDVARAIANNGKVIVKFHCENVMAAIGFSHNTGGNVNYQPITYTTPNYYNTGGQCVYTTYSDTSDAIISPIYGKTVSHTQLSNNEMKIETGRVEKGSYSNQSFIFDDTKFYDWCTWVLDWKILPKSQKPMTKDDLNSFWCGTCGAKRKKNSHKFCPRCGSNNWMIK